MKDCSLMTFIKPFKKFDDFLFACFLIVQYKHLNIDCLCDLFEKLTNTSVSHGEFDSFLRKFNFLSDQYANHFFSSLNELNEKIDAILGTNEKINFISPAETCQFCANRRLRTTNVVAEEAISYFVNQKPKTAGLISKKCTNCSASHFLTYAELNSIRRPFEYCTQSRFLAFSKETIFETKILEMFTSDLLFKHSTFQAFCSSFNYISSLATYISNTPERKLLIEKRLIENWFFYKALKFSEEYFFGLEGLPFPYLYELDNYLKCLKPFLLPYFTKKWSGIFHKSICFHEKCSLTISLDGNWKCNRLKCMFEDVFMISPEQGRIKIGCVQTPMRGSFFCKKHEKTSDERYFKFGDGVIKIRLSEIRPKIGRFREENLIIHDSFYDQDDRLLFLVSYSDENEKVNYFWLTENQLKSARNKDFTIEIDDRIKKHYTLKNFDKVLSKCEKKARTKGILISTTNCGIVTGYKEIFGSESLTQAAAFCCELVDYYDSWPKFLVYDNSCKLRHFVKDSKKFDRSSERALKLDSSIFIVDRFHFHTHSDEDKYCKEHCDANDHPELKGINTSVVEEINFWFSGYKHLLKHMNYERFHFLLYILFDEYNHHKLNSIFKKKMKK